MLVSPLDRMCFFPFPLVSCPCVRPRNNPSTCISQPYGHSLALVLVLLCGGCPQLSLSSNEMLQLQHHLQLQDLVFLDRCDAATYSQRIHWAWKTPCCVTAVITKSLHSHVWEHQNMGTHSARRSPLCDGFSRPSNHGDNPACH